MKKGLIITIITICVIAVVVVVLVITGQHRSGKTSGNAGNTATESQATNADGSPVLDSGDKDNWEDQAQGINTEAPTMNVDDELEIEIEEGWAGEIH